MSGSQPGGSPLGYLWWLVALQRGRVALGAILGTLWMVGLILPPYLLSLAIDRGLAAGRTGPLLLWGAVLLGVGVLNAWLAVMRHRTMTKIRIGATLTTVRTVEDHCMRLGATLSRQASTGEVVTIGIGDVWAMSQSLTITGPGVGALIAYAVVAVLLFSVSLPLALTVLLGVPILMIAMGPLLGHLQQVGSTYRERQSVLTTGLVDIVTGLGVLTGFGGKDNHARRYRDESRALVGEGYAVGAVTSWIQTLGVGLPVLFLAVVTWFAARMAERGDITIGELVAVYGYVGTLVVPVSFFIEGGVDLSRALVSARRVVDFLALRPAPQRTTVSAAPSPGARLMDPDSGVEVPAGKLSAVVSADPAAALALVDRLGRLSDTDVIWGDGVRLADLPMRRVRDHIIVADNEADIFAGSLREVVSGRFDPEDRDVAEALHVAVADDLVAGLPDGVDAQIDPQGRNLSGGQRQRVRLARAVLADPEVLIAVDPTSAVDAHTEATMAERVRQARIGRTTLVVTTSTVLLDRADVVFYLSDGRVAASGSHRDLIRSEDGYRRLLARLGGESDAGDEMAQSRDAALNGGTE